MIHLNTHLSKRNEDVKEKWRCKWNGVDDSFEHTLIKEKWRCKWVDDSFEHTFIKEKWRCKWSRWFIWTHTYQREMKM